jgi:M6 family metalloprotease-like protein
VGVVGLVAASGSLVPASTASATHRRPGPLVHLSGHIVAMAGDPRTPAVGEPTQRYVLASRRGVVPFTPARAVEPALIAAAGTQTVVVGRMDAAGRLDVVSVEPLAGRRAATPKVTGSQTWISLLCRFQGTPSVPHPKSWYDGLLGGASNLMSDYWEETSYGAIDLAGGTVVAWVDMPHTRASYGPAASADLTQMAQDCADASNSIAIDFKDYMGIDMHFNEDMTYSWGGSVFLTLDGASRVWPATWMSDWGNAGVQGHEMGHGFGLLHSSGPYAQTYDSHWDQMSFAYAGPADPTYGNTPEGTIAYHRDYLGWFDPSWTTTVPDGVSTTVTLRPLSDAASAGGERQIVIPVTTSKRYTVEARERSGADLGVPGDAVVIHDVDDARRNSGPFDRIAQVVDVDGNGNVNDAGAMWVVGETFTDIPRGITVSVDSKAPDGSYQVTVAHGALDVVAPTNPTTFASSSHTPSAWSADDTIRMTMAGAADSGSGVHGYSIAWGGVSVAADTTEDLGVAQTSFTSPSQSDGDRYVALRTVDAAGNWSAQIVRGPYRIDATAPAAVTMDGPVGRFTWDTGIPVAWSGGADAGSGSAGVDVRYRTTTAKGDFGSPLPWMTGTSLPGGTFAGTPGSTYCFGARGGDVVGNTSSWSVERCSAVPVDDTALRVIGRWTRSPGGTFLDSLTTSRSRGARLRIAKVHARHVAVMASTCPSCGRVRVLWRGRVLEVLDLSATPGQLGVVFGLRTGGRVKAGTLVLEVASRRRPVSIDAVGVTRA